MKFIAQTLLVVCMAGLLASGALAKRSAPKEVPALTRNGVVYSVPHEKMGTVAAKEEKSGKELWSKQIYTVKYEPGLETDVQDCFITELRFEKEVLIVSNENNDQYELDPATQAVKVIKGAAVVDRTKK